MNGKRSGEIRGDLGACPRAARPLRLAFGLSLVAALAAGCGDDGDRGPAGPPGPPGPPGGGGAELAGLMVEIVEITGGSGAGGNFRVGDEVSVRFTLQDAEGNDFPIEELDSASIYLSGPTFNYQRVIERQRDLADAAERNEDGSFTYVFADRVPDVYLPPYNDSPAFGPGDGELTGMALLSGTYSVGIELYDQVEIDGESIRDAGNAVGHFLFGDAESLDLREVVGMDNCNLCHDRLQAHGTFRRSVDLCLLCHTAGAEDRNDPDIEGGTPGASIEFSVMIHKIHNGAHLPSVLGVGTRPDGTRDYEVEPVPYRLVGFGGRVHDYSDVEFPLWPSLSFPTLRDEGYSSLSDEAKEKEDTIRSGAIGCLKCHGDPDGEGPAPPPAQGELYRTQQTRRSCGACHDDIDWDLPYRSNGATMPPIPTDSACIVCHGPGSSIGVEEAHLHPIDNTDFAPGVNFVVNDVFELRGGDGDGAIEVGEVPGVRFTMSDDLGNPISAADAAQISVAVTGPTWNRNLVHETSLPLGLFGAGPSYTTSLPEEIELERLGVASGGADVFMTGRAPIWTDPAETVLERTGLDDGFGMLVEAATAVSNVLSVDDASAIDRLSTIVVDDGQPTEEYVTVRLVEPGAGASGADRVWTTPLRFDHGAGATVAEVVVEARTKPVDYVLSNPVTGEITLVPGAFGAGSTVIVSYTTDFVVPDVYRPPFNDSPDLDESWGDWGGKPLVDGTYTLGIWGHRNVTLTAFGETNTYRDASPAATLDFLVGAATTIEPADGIASGDTCNRCHDDIRFHGGLRRGYDTCVLCHMAGSEDRPPYVAGGAPPTTGATVDFRTMIHKIHHGSSLAAGEDYVLVGFGFRPFPNNFTPHTYDDVVFPVWPGGTAECRVCHGDENESWVSPEGRTHPMGQEIETRSWRAACGSCHDSGAARAHIEVNTTSDGSESCALCHGEGEDEAVRDVHRKQ